MPDLPSSAGSTPKTITSRSVLLVEGNDEKGFFEALAKDMHLQIGIDLDLRLVNGKGKYKEQFQAFLNDPGFYNVKSYGIVRDADNNAQDTFKSIQSMLNGFGYRCPDNHAEFGYDIDKKLKVGIFVMPGHMLEGMLEDLCLQSVQDHPIMPFVREYIANVKQKMQAEAPKNERKAKVQTFLAGMKDIVPHLGVAADRGYWNFKSTAIDEIRAFIHELTI